MRGVPLPGQYASEVGAFAPAWAPGHTVSRVGLALLSATRHVNPQSCNRVKLISNALVFSGSQFEEQK